MMDALSQLDWAARDLLGKVDDLLLRHGAPDGHPIWPQLRELGALPVDVYEFLYGWDPAELDPTRSALGQVQEALQYQHATLADAADLATEAWPGSAGNAFIDRWRSYAATVAGTDTTIDHRLADTVAYLVAVGDWARTWRQELARTILSCLTSTEAITLHDPKPDAAARAAATIGARILQVGAHAINAGESLLGNWRQRLAPLP